MTSKVPPHPGPLPKERENHRPSHRDSDPFIRALFLTSCCKPMNWRKHATQSADDKQHGWATAKDENNTRDARLRASRNTRKDSKAVIRFSRISRFMSGCAISFCVPPALLAQKDTRTGAISGRRLRRLLGALCHLLLWLGQRCRPRQTRSRRK